ncbi:MAG: oligosaccharide flippase family protein, partial [Pseudomonadota bacterium]
MNVIARSVRSTAWIVADSWISAALGAISYLFLIRILGPEIFGTIAIAGLFFGAVGTFVGSALTESIQQREEVEAGHLNMTFWLNSSLCFVLAGLIAAAAVPIGAFFGSEALTKVIPALALAALISSFGALPRALLERKLQHDKLAALNALAGIPATVVALGMAWSGFGVWSLVGSILTGTCLGTLGVWLMVDWRPGLAMERRHFADLSDFNRNTVLTNALGYADDAIPRFTLAIVAGERAVGLFDLAIQISSTLSSAIMGPIGEVAMNTIARLQSREEHVRELLHRVFTL